nr:uncharacterized protein LOC117983275 isoform X2 [Maniola hyperantus]
MAMKEWLQWLPPPRSLLALLIAIAGFSGRLFAAHVTHSPTLLVDTCHSLCRLVGLITTLLAFKYERADEGAGREGRLRNTFGWARIEVVGRLSVHVLFASFALALVVNALQLGVHSSHGQPPIYPRVIVGSAVIGLMFHAINYMLLAGRELSYSRRLSVTEGGEVVLKTGSAEPVLAHAPTDIASSLFVMGAGLTLEWEPVAARIADPALSASAAIILVIFNYPFMPFRGVGALANGCRKCLGACDLRARSAARARRARHTRVCTSGSCIGTGWLLLLTSLTAHMRLIYEVQGWCATYQALWYWACNHFSPNSRCLLSLKRKRKCW